MTNNKRHFFIFLLIISPVLLIAVKMGYDKYSLSKSGVFVIGRLVEKTKPGFHTGTGKYMYHYKDKRFMVSLGSYNLDSFVFINVSSKDPSKAFVVLDTDVPNCVLQINAPKEGWKELPINICN